MVVEGDGEGSSGVEDRGEEGGKGKTEEERKRRLEGERWEVGEWERRHRRGVRVLDLVEEVEGGRWDGSVGASKVKLLLSEGGC